MIWRLIRCGLAALTIAFVWWLWSLWPVRPVESIRVNESFGLRLLEPPAPAGSFLAWGRIESKPPINGWLLIRRADGHVLRRCEAMSRLGRSADGGIVAYDDADRVVLIDATTGATIRRTDPLGILAVKSPEREEIRFAPDGGRFAVCGAGVFVIDAGTCEMTAYLSKALPPVEFSRDGSMIAAAIEGANEIGVWNAKSGQLTARLKYDVQGKPLHICMSPRQDAVGATIVVLKGNRVTRQMMYWKIAHPEFPINLGHCTGKTAFSDDGRIVYHSDGYNGIDPMAFDMDENPGVNLALGLYDSESDLAFVADNGRRVGVIRGPHTLTMYNSLTKTQTHEFDLPESPRDPAAGRAISLFVDNGWLSYLRKCNQNALQRFFEKLFRRPIFDKYQTHLVNLETGQAVAIGEYQSIVIDDASDEAWTTRQHPGGWNLLERWPLTKSPLPIWLWLLTAFGSCYFFWEWSRHRATRRPIKQQA